MKILVIGGVAGGMSFAARARRLAPDAEIIVFERGPYPSFANCGLPYHIGGEIEQRQKLTGPGAENLMRSKKLDIRTGSEVISINRIEKNVRVRSVADGQEYAESYDHLVIATGASPIRPNLPGMDRKGVYTLRSVPDMDAINEWIHGGKLRYAVVVGGGYIGLEMVEQLYRVGLEITLIERNSQVAKTFDADFAEILIAEMKRHGVEVLLSENLIRIDDPRKDESAAAGVLVTESGKRIPADLVVLGMGVRPETRLAIDAGLKIGKSGGIVVDEFFRTSDSSIHAVGDVIEVTHTPTGERALIALAGPANRQGRMLADNLLGDGRPYKGTLGTAILRVFDQVAAGTGASEAMLHRAGVEYEKIYLFAASHAGYYPGAETISLKVLFDRATGKLYGAQAVGKDGVDKRIDVLATAMHGGLTIEELIDVELAYAPPFGSAKDPINFVGMIGENIRSGRTPTVQWNQIAKYPNALILDVREEKERAESSIQGSLHIPLGDLWKRWQEVPRDKTILVHCASGQRSHNAVCLLRGKGLDARNLSGGIKSYQLQKID